MPVGRCFARDDIVDMADRKTFNIHPLFPRNAERLNPVGCENQVEIKRTVLELHEIFTPGDFSGLLFR